MARTLVACFVFAVFGMACAPEFEEKKIDDIWVSYAAGLCETKDGKEPQRSCTEAKECSYYCCECDSGRQYTIAACHPDEGCEDFGDACRVAESEVCK